MPFVLTIDQRGSSTTTDLVDHMLARLTRIHTRLPFERTAGDEFQGLLEDPVSVVDAILDLVRDGNWHIGLGAGPVAEPLPSSTRAARGSAFERPAPRSRRPSVAHSIWRCRGPTPHLQPRPMPY